MGIPPRLLQNLEDYFQSGLKISSIRSMGTPRVLDDIESISNMKKMNQTLKHYDILKKSYWIWVNKM